jgi:predicted HNH restriction endonuclease
MANMRFQNDSEDDDLPVLKQQRAQRQIMQKKAQAMHVKEAEVTKPVVKTKGEAYSHEKAPHNQPFQLRLNRKKGEGDA